MTYEEAKAEAETLNPAMLRRFATWCEGQAATGLSEVRDAPIYAQAGIMARAAELLRAADTFRGRANMLGLTREDELVDAD